MSVDKSWRVQHASEVGLKKLRKYSVPAMAHHTYVVGTSKSCPSPVLLVLSSSSSDSSILVLHPCLHSHWFTTTADLDMQEDAINSAEVAFRYIAETYLERKTPLAIIPASKPVAPPAIRTMSFLASACSFQRPNTATSTTTIAKCSPQEELADKLDHYFRFEAAPPMEQAEQQEGHPNGEPSAQEVLLNPLIWWKVSHVFHLCVKYN